MGVPQGAYDFEKLSDTLETLGDTQREATVDKIDNVALFEQESLWNIPILEDAYHRNKVNLLHGMIPPGVKTILDVGCGNGAITNEFMSDYWIVGGDRSWMALQYLQTQSIQLSADHLPFRNRSFDLVMSHQVLEHLPEGVFQQAIAELNRVARQYLLVSVPYKDPLLHAHACCGECRYKYNVWGHLRNFNDLRSVRCLFPSFALRIHAFCGRENEYPTRIGLWLRQWLGGDWAVAPLSVCPKCRSRKQYRADFPRRAIASLVNRVDRCFPKTKAFWWLVCLFERG